MPRLLRRLSLMEHNTAIRENIKPRRVRAVRTRAFYLPLFSLALFAAAAWPASSRLLVSRASTPSTATRSLPSSAPPALATLTVTSTNDNGPGSLRQAISAALSGDTITFAPNVTGTITLANASGELKIDKDLTINGPGKDQLSVSGNNRVRVFNIGSVSTGISVQLSGLTITKGAADDTDPNGSAIRNRAALTIKDCLITNNKDDAEGSDFKGGGIYNAGSLTINNSTISNNQFRRGAGIANDGGTLTINDSIISNNLAEPDEGGGLFNDGGTVTINRSSFLRNRAQHEGGGIYSKRGALNIADSAFSENSSFNGGGGAIFNTLGRPSSINNSRIKNNSTLVGPGGGIHSQSTLSISNSDISDNVALGLGGGLFVTNRNSRVDIIGCTISNNFTDLSGGGIAINTGQVNITRSTVSHNATNGNPGKGGGIDNQDGTLTIKDSTISDNRSKDLGGGIHNETGDVNISASTISGNTIVRFGGGIQNGGGIGQNQTPGPMTLKNCTVVSNTATGVGEGHGGGISGRVTLENTIVALNNADNNDSGPNSIIPVDISGTVTSNGFNLIGNTQGATVNANPTDILNVNPLLGPLQDNGGPTLTHAPLPGSPVIDAGKSGANADQRGLPRPFDLLTIANAPGGDASDIGALELQPIKISGRVKLEGGAGVGGVTLTLSGKQTVVVITKADGSYSFDNVPPGGSFTLLPSKPDFEFDPPSVSFDRLIENRQVDFNASLIPVPTPTPDASDDFEANASPNFNVGLLSLDPAAFNPDTTVKQEDGQLKITPPNFAFETIEVTVPCNSVLDPNCTQTRGGSFLNDGTFDGGSFSGYVSKRDVDLNVSTSVSVKVEKPLAGDGAQTLFSVGKDQENFFGLHVAETTTAQQGGADLRNLIFDIVLGGRKFQTSDVPYVHDKHLYWRIRFDAPAAEVIFETSRDGQAWENPCPPPQTCRFRVGDVSTQVASQLLAGTVKRINDPGDAVFDDYKVANPTGLEFSEQVTNATELERTIQIKLRRTGGADSRASVDYTINDNSAPGAPGIATGTVIFGERETDASFTIDNPLFGDTRRTGNRLFTLRLSRPLGGALASGNTASLTITDDEFTGNAIDDPVFFASQQYCDFLNRPPDAEGLGFWSGQFTPCNFEVNCMGREQIHVSAAFFLSIEFQQTGYFAYRAYQASFGRMPLHAEFLPDVRTVRGNVIVNQGEWEKELEKNKREFLDAWVERPAFKQKYDAMNSGEFVDALYKNAGLTLSTQRRTELVLHLLTGLTTRRKVFGGLIDSKATPGTPEQRESDEFRRAHFNRAFVLTQYFGYLQRDPDASGFQFWLDKLDGFHGDFVAAEMVKAFVTSEEYRNRFNGRQTASCVGP